MPYASDIQLVNDANGTAYAFLTDNGAIWQCQWDPQAGGWVKGQAVPQAFGEKPQALYLEDLWPTRLSNTNAANPGIVLAYRLGEGSSAEIWASFGTWAGDGSLQWMEPQQLTKDQVNDQAFSLVEAEAGSFALVVQKKQAGAGSSTTLDKQNAASMADLQAKLEAEVSGARPDSDLYVNHYKLQMATDSTTAVVLNDITAGQLSATIQRVRTSTPQGAAPLVFSGNTQLNRQDLINPLATLNSARFSRSGNEAGSETATGGSWAGPAFQTQLSGGGTLRAGLINQSIMRWELNLPANYYAVKGNPKGSEYDYDHNQAENSFIENSKDIEARNSLAQEIAHEATEEANIGAIHNTEFVSSLIGSPLMLTTTGIGMQVFGYNEEGQGVIEKAGLNLKWRGAFGIGNFGAGGLTSTSVAKFIIGYGDEDTQSMTSRIDSLPKTLADGSPTSAFSYNIGGGGSVQTIYQYNNNLFQSPNLISVRARESVGIDFSARWFKFSANAESTIRVSSAVNTGYEFSQSISSDNLPEWLADVGYVSGFLGKAERHFITGNSFRLRHRKFKTPGIQEYQKKALNSAYGVTSGADYDPRLNAINTVGGTILSILGPASIAGIKGQNPNGMPGTQYSNSSGVQTAGRITAGVLYMGLLGIEVNLADRFTRYFKGTNKGNWEDIFFANAGIALPLGGMIPLLSYLHTWKSTPSTGLTGSSDFNSQGFYRSAESGNAYPMSYAPASASNAYFSSASATSTGNSGLLGVNSSPLLLLTLNTYNQGLNPSISPTNTLPLTLVNAGTNLVDGSYTNVSILGVSADQDPQSIAQANFSVAGGSIVADSFEIVRGGTYLALPETQEGSGIYALILDVFTTGIAELPAAGTGNQSNGINSLPMITLHSRRSGSPLSSQSIQRIQNVPVTLNSQPQGVMYPIYDIETGEAIAPASNNNSGYSYANVPVSVYSSASPLALPLLNPGVTATVQLSAGVIQRVILDQPILIAGASTGANPSPTYSVQLQLPAVVLASLPAGSPAPSYAVTPESLAFNNFVEDEQFSSQVGATNSGVYLAAGLSDQLPLYPFMGAWQVQNRVTYVTATGNGSQMSVTYLNGSNKNTNGTLTQVAEVAASDLSLDALYSKDNSIVFSAASSPTAVTIAGPTSTNTASSYGGDTFVAWVEASQPVIPITGKDGTENYQAFLESLYGSQRINYRINAANDTGWLAPNLADLYSPQNAVIRELKAFNAVNPATGTMATLLAWSEVSIDAIKGAVQRMGKGLSIPAVIKVGWLNPTPATFQWNDLFSDAAGVSTIQVIPWDSATAVGLGISDLSLASAPLAQVVNGSTTVSETPVLSWSQDVRTPYRQSVLNDQPYIYLQFGQLKSGSNDINIGSTDSAYTATTASATGLNFAIAGALPSSQATAVQNTNGTGVLTTGMGSLNKMIRNVINNMAPATYTPATNPNAIGVFTGAINSTTLTVSAISQGALRVNDVITGAGIAAGTTITAVNTVDASGVGTYSVNQSQTVAATTLEAIPGSTRIPTSTFSASISGTTLSVSGLSSGSLAVGDGIFGQGVTPGTTITALGSFNASTGTGTFTVNKSQTLAPSALVATPGAPTVPYTIEFWAQLQPNSNANGAGLVALGQPSNGPIGVPTMPDGWLLTSSFLVDQITYQQAAARGLISSIPTTVSNPSTAVYGWGWAVVADGTNTTAMAGTGGSNIYSNALQINNLVSGISLKGIDQFLANYNLTSSDLTGIDGTTAAIAAQVPLTELQFSTAINSTTNQASSSLNAIAVDTDSAILNQGLVLADGSQTISANLESMFKALWAFQEQTGMAKVNLSLAPDSTNITRAAAGQLPSQYSSESYAGYELGFTLSRGTAISVNGSGQLVFDVGVGSSLTSQALGTVPADLRDGQWHYIVASYLPSYEAYTVDDTVVQLPTNVGSASLYVDNTLVASNTSVVDAYDPTNGNDQALLLATNSGGAIDQLAFYDKALSASAFTPNLSGDWPAPTAAEALAVMESLGYSIATKSPDPGQIPGAVTSHWQARAVNPNNALLGTYYSFFTPDGQGGGSWSQASNLNPTLARQATTASASRTGSLQDDLVLSIASTTWSQSGALTVNNAASSYGFNPSRQRLGSITVTLTNRSDSSESTTLTLKPDQILIGNNTLGELQPRASQSNLNYEVLTNTPEFSLVIPKDVLPHASVTNPLADQYAATYTFNFVSAAGNSDAGTAYTVTNTTAATLNTYGAAITRAATTGIASQDQFSSLKEFQSVIATAAINEQAPTQLKYIDSGEVLTGPQNFGGSQVAGSFTGSNGNRYGWLAIAQPQSFDAISNPAGRIYIQYTGQSLNGTATSDVAQAPSTWLNALAKSTFSPDTPNLPLLGNANNPSSSGGLLIEADATTGWDQSFGQVMLVADVNGDGIEDLMIASPQANGGGCVYIIDGTWISNNLTNPDGATTINLANANNLGSYVTTLTPTAVDPTTDNITVAGFGSALAYDSSSSTLLIGAPNYLRQLDTTNTTNPGSSLQAIGAVYSYSYTSSSSAYTQKYQPLLGSGGTSIALDANNSPVATYWGSQLGTAIAVDSNGGIAISAPGVVAAMLYSGTIGSSSKSSSDSDYGDGALLKIQTPSTSNSFSVSIADGTSSSGLVDVVDSAKVTSYQTEITNYMQNLKELQVDTIASATTYYNQALQANPVGAVYFLTNGSDLASIKSTTTQTTTTPIIDADSVATATHGGATFYGAQPWNSLGASGFGKSLAFGDFNNTNSNAMLAIGASQTGGSGAVYLINTNDAFTSSSQGTWLEAINLGNNQYCAYLASGFTLYGAASQDNFGNGVVNLGDVNDDGYQDLLIQAYNANSGAGSGYVLFGNDNLTGNTTPETDTTATAPNPGTSSVAPGSIGLVKRADGSSTITTPILSEIGSGLSTYTGQGTFGSGDVNGDGRNDILLGSGPNGSGYLTWGQTYLEAINNLQLNKLTSDTGYLLNGLATATKNSLRSIGDFNGDGYGDFISVNPGTVLTTVRLELGANTQAVLADYLYNYYTFTVNNGTQVLPAGDSNGDGFADIALVLDKDSSSTSQGQGSSAGILYGRASGDLPIGAGFGLLAPVDSSGVPQASLPGLDVAKGYTDATPTVISIGTTLYAVVKGYGNTHLYFNQSTDAGNTWNTNWTDISATQSGLVTNSAPSLAFFNNKLYLAFLNTNATPTISLSSWDPLSQNPASWSAPMELSDSLNPGAGFSSSHTPQLVDRGDALGLIWVDASSGTLYGSYSSVLPAIDAESSWSTPSQLLQRVEVAGSANFNPIASTRAPSFTWLGDQAVVAVTNGSSVNVYENIPNTLSWEVASTFGSAVGEAAISTSPVLATTDTGLALTYGSSDGAINLQRLDLLEANGTPRDLNQLWLKTTLNRANSGLNSTLATVPLSVNGTLLLSNVRSEDNAIWLHAIPVNDTPNSSTWLNSSVELPADNGNSIDSQYSRTSNWQNLAGGSSPTAPAFAELNGVLYAAVRGENDGLWWSSSSNGGQSWQGWQQITNAYSAEYSTTTISPSLAVYDGWLYMSYAYQNKLFTTYYDGYGWSELPVVPLDVNGNSFTVQYASLIAEDDGLSIYYVGDNGTIYRTSSTEPWGPLYSYWQDSRSLQYSGGAQASSGNLSIARHNKQTYIAYQYGNSTRLTTSADPSTPSSWSLLSSANGVPQPSNPSASGVGLTANDLGLVLSYADVINNKQVVVLQQGMVTASSWTTSSTSNVAAPGESQGVNTSLFSTSGTSAVLLGAINTNANQAITTAFSSLTIKHYGDLNGDGYLDYLAPGGLESIDTGARPNFYSVWSIRAAGDVNGNGADDILLALTANDSADQSIQTVLIDGSLFKISNNTFSLANLWEPLDPYAANTLNVPVADRPSSSNPGNELPSLQNWIQPILDYIPSTTIKSATLSQASTPIQGYQVAYGSLYNSASLSSTVAADGTIFIANQGFGGNNIFLAYGNPNNASPDWLQVQIPGASTDSAPSLAFYNKTLYIAYKSPQGPTDYSNNGLNIAYNTTPGDYSSWTTYSISDQSSIFGPTLVNEGNQLALYFVANNSGSEILSLASTDPSKSSSWGGTYSDGAFSGGPIAIADSSGGRQTSSSSLSATRFQGKTVLAYVSGTYRGGSQYHYWIAEKTNGNFWSAYEIDPDFNNEMHLPCIASDASRLYLTTGYLNPLGSYSYITTGTSYDAWGAPATLPNTANSIHNSINLASTGSNLYAIWPYGGNGDNLTISPLSLSTDPAVQPSLAGYSIDGDVDVNGDGFSDMLISDPSNPNAGIDNQYVLFGGDYLDLASQVGTEANDTLIGTPLADVIFSIGGADVLASQGGADLIYTGSGDDQISIQDNAFRRIDAGSGFDQLLLEGATNQAYDFRLNVDSPQYFVGTKLQDIELISSLSYGANTLSIDAAAVNASNPDRILFITSDASDTIALSNEFVRNVNLDTAFAGQRWYAFAANQQGGLAPAFETTPALVYVSLPADAGANWLDTNITLGGFDTASTAAAMGSDDEQQSIETLQEDLFVAPSNAKRTLFGDGLSVTAYSTTTDSPLARFAIQRQDTSDTQVVMYSTTDTNSLATSGVDHAAALGLLVFQPGESAKDISVPLFTDSLKTRRNSSLSLEVQELPYQQQQELHLLLQPSIDPSSGRRPVLSGMTLVMDDSAASALLSLRADSNTPADAALKMQLSLRESADSTTTVSRQIAIADFSPTASRVAADAALGHLTLDRDGRANQQVNLQLQLNLTDGLAVPLVSLLGPELEPESTVKLVNDQQVRFLQHAPLSTWRADSGKGQVTFGLQSATGSLTLISGASGGSAGSLTPSNAINDNASKGWQSTEAQAIGSRSITTGQNLTGQDWTPTASQNGVSLELLELVVDGNQVTAFFADGVTGVYWQNAGSAPTVAPVPAAVEVQRLAGYANSLGFYSVDSISGNVGTLRPGDSGYLQAALERSRREDLLLDAATLPAYGGSATFNSLPLDTQKSYGLLMLQNSDPSIIFSSFAAANPGGVTQMVSLSSSSNSMVLGIEDLWTMASNCDNDFNDLIVIIKNVSLALF